MTTPLVPARRARVRELRDLAVRRPLLATALLAGVPRVLFALSSFVLNGSHLIPDEVQYVTLAKTVVSGHTADSWAHLYGQHLYDSTWSFMAPLVLLFHVFGTSRLVGQLLAVAFGVVAAVATTRLARELVPAGWAIAAGGLVALLPSQILWSSVVLRESLVWAGLVLLALAVVYGARDPSRWAVIGAVAIALLLLYLGHLRQQTAVAAAWSLILSACVIPTRRRLVRIAGVSAIALVVPLVLGLGIGGTKLVRDVAPHLGRTRAYLGLGAESAFTPTSIYHGPPTEETGPVTDTIPGGGPAPTTPTTAAPPTTEPPVAVAGPAGPTTPASVVGLPANPPPTLTQPTPPTTASALGGAAEIAAQPGTTVTTPGGAKQSLVIAPRQGAVYVVDEGVGANVREIPRGLLGTLFRPFPWESRPSLGLLLARVENLLWYALYVLALWGLWLSRRRLDVVAFPAIVTAAVIAVAAVTQGNVGTAFRHRGQIAWALAILSVVALEHLWRTKAAPRWHARHAPA